MKITDLKSAIDAVGGITAAAEALGLSYVAVSKWVKRGRLPRTEFTGETDYSSVLAAASKGAFTAKQLRTVAGPTATAA